MIPKLEKIVFFGNWGAGASAFEKLLGAGSAIEAVVTQYDPSKDQTDTYYNAVYHIAEEKGIPSYRHYKELPATEITQKVLGLSVAYDKIFDPSFLKKLKIINFHPSILPDYRGPSPIQWQLMERLPYIGMTAHLVDSEIDSGEILSQDRFQVDYDACYDDFLNSFNQRFSDFVLATLESFCKKRRAVPFDSKNNVYKPRLQLPENINFRKVGFISELLNRPKIAFFTGNRAEFGIQFPLIYELSKEYFLDIFVSGAHLVEPWNSIVDIHEKVDKYQLPVRIIPVQPVEGKDPYLFSLPSIYSYMVEYFKRYGSELPYRFTIVLGDRIETMGFALASFYSRIPIIHICGGDVANVPFFDTSIRHSISKIAHIHFATNDFSKKVLLQMGEEPWRIFNTGNLSYSYESLGLLEKTENLAKELGLSKEAYLIICTMHPSHQKSSKENLSDFQTVVRAIKDFEAKILITYPNNDIGSELILSTIQVMKREFPDRKNRITLISSLGTSKYLSLLKNFKTIVIGNSSSGLTETALYNVPVLNLGNRQTDRVRADNVFDCEIDQMRISERLGNILENYDQLRSKFSESSELFGSSDSAALAKNIIDGLIKKETDHLLFKKFQLEKNEPNCRYSATSR